MKYFTTEELRNKFLDFFSRQDHLVEKSYNLIPQDDKSILLIGAGMAPLKKYFMGLLTPPNVRMATCQKCIRVGDLDNVGETSRHLTFFEMLGNFSFADYFKKESLKWGIEFLTKELEIPLELLWVSVYEEDLDSYNIWKDYIKFDENRIVKLGKEDNFWEIGQGPCGPCSEIYFDRGEKYSCGNKDCKPGCDCDRYIEVWNHVFTQFNKNKDGSYSELANKNIDTGMGLERLAVIIQEKENVFEIDSMKPILELIEQITSKKYGKTHEIDKAIRIIVDHIRSITFMVGDGVIPSNESRGYVLRKLIRRAALQFKKLGYDGYALTTVAKKVIEINGGHYTLLEERKEMILNMIDYEEKKFNQTINRGINYIEEITENASTKTISGKDIFKLYDTFGFPVEITEEIAKEKGFNVDMASFDKEMELQKQRAKENADNSSKAWQNKLEKEITKLDDTIFTGYTSSYEKAKILKLASYGELSDCITDSDNAILVTDVTPFYATGGGQVGDSGYIECKFDGLDNIFYVSTTEKIGNIYVHFGKCDGTFNVGDEVELNVNSIRRKSISRNHSATHLLNYMLSVVLGTNVEQAGSLVEEDRLRFDFTYFNALTEEEIRKVEYAINDYILNGYDVNANVYDVNEARKLGAKSLFTEKYGKEVRVVKMGDSIEFCGGIHVNNTNEIGMFKIISEKAIGSGIRRIEAITGKKSVEFCFDEYDANKEITNILRTQRHLVIDEVQNLKEELKASQKEIDELKSLINQNESKNIKDTCENIGDINFYYKVYNNKSNDDLKSLSDSVIGSDENAAVLFISDCNDKVLLLSAASKKSVENGYKANIIVSKLARLLGGGGGGRPNFASAGAKDINKLKEINIKEFITNELNI